MRLLRYWKLGVIGMALAALGGVWGQYYWTHANLTPVERGARVVQRLGCFNCHGAGGMQGIPNPGSRIKEVPSWTGGTWMMYTRTTDDVREDILDGAPKRLQEAYQARRPDQGLLKMPAYRGRISPKELEDVVAYYQAVSEMHLVKEPLPRKGYDLAQALGCFGCHGPGGHANPPNPGSLKGYIPAWSGKDFPELVANDDELKEWILEGNTQRFQRNPLAAYFLKRQVIKMPGYQAVLQPGDLEALIAYIHWVRR